MNEKNKELTCSVKDFGSMAPGVFSAVRFLETISCQLADATQFLDDLEYLTGGKFSQSECVAMTEAARVLRRRCTIMIESLEHLNILKS